MSPEARLRQTYRTSWFLGLAVAAAVAIYGSVVLILATFTEFQGFGHLDEGSAGTLSLAFLVVALGQIPLISFLRRLLHPRVAAAEGVEALGRELQRASILALALCELPGVMGLGFYLITARLGSSLILAAISLGLLVLHFPRWDTWRSFLADEPT